MLTHVPGAAQSILDNIARGEFRIPLRLADRAKQVARLMKRYADQPIDLADACLIDLATEVKTARIFTLDSDFEIYRWGRNRPFELVLEPP